MTGEGLSTKLTRRTFLKAVGASAAWIALTTTPGCESTGRRSTKNARAQTGQPPPAQPQDMRTFRSRPDLSPPAVEVTTQAHDTAPGYICVAPKNGPEESSPAQDGAMILDDRGQPVWFRPMHREEQDTMDFKVQNYRGKPALTWWEGVHTGYGSGEYVILDRSYHEIARVRAGNGYRGDHHEFLVTPRDTALLDIYGLARWDLSSVGGPKDGQVLDGIAQEVDIETGEVLFEWHSLDHVGLEESYYKPESPEGPFDYFHINSIDVDHDGDLLISARRTSTVYKINHKTGEIIWRLGGKKSDFEVGLGTRTAYQHDARRQPDGTITIFDNGGEKDEQSRGIVIELDEEAMTATLVREYTHPHGRIAALQGSMQVLPNGNVFIGWGSDPVFSEFSSGGELLFNANFPPEVESYRAFRFPWSGRPDDDPAVAAERGPEDEVTVYASWNGATEVAAWQVLAGPSPDRLRSVGSAPRDGFETAIAVRTAEPYVGAQARNRSGRVLGTAKSIKV